MMRVDALYKDTNHAQHDDRSCKDGNGCNDRAADEPLADADALPLEPEQRSDFKPHRKQHPRPAVSVAAVYPS